MSSMAAIPGTGPSTGPVGVVRKVARRRFADLPTDRTLVMGVVNVTDNSFSDGGNHFDAEAAIQHGLKLHYAGADLIDVGGESTAPGRDAVDPDEEQRRVLPVIEALVRAGAVVSVDTRHAATARAALDHGEVIINDVSGLNFEPEMAELVAESGAHYIITHNRGDAHTMDELADYDDVVTEVIHELSEVKDQFIAAGAQPEQLILDPGLGFAKSGEQNWELLRGVERLVALGFPVLVGASRKRFLGTLLADSRGHAPAPVERDHATAAVSALAAAHGVWAVRVHDVAASVDAVKVAAAWGGPNTAPQHS
ncbi:dihydropteroate synthase [Citricoccus muralis]|uniref:Dihydropteroate synthase n=1 Tax=Citricoccus muralis TaxID=169134 RepID=A0ABY8H6K0_9MICC|nr:dihydropteroate synthase [Citricoccus muralis]WFP16763.1 dihydropteroate synthase [Citricoccus muralis]